MTLFRYSDTYGRRDDFGVYNPLLQRPLWHRLKNWLLPKLGVQAASYPLNGVDVSAWQGVMNWEKAAHRINFAYVRAGAGNDYLDTQFPRNRGELLRLGIPFGLYWYVKPARSWSLHAQGFYDAWKAAGSTLPPVVDVETTDGLGKTAMDSWLLKMVNRFEELSNKQVFIYTSPGFWNTALPLTGWAKTRGLWDAHWTSADTPILPNEWANVAHPKYPKKWVFWQWSANGNKKGAEYGAQSTDIDLDRYYGSVTDFIKDFGVAPHFPSPPPVTFQKVQVIVDFVNCRAEPDANSTDLGEVKKDSVLTVEEESGDYYRVGSFWVYKNGVKRL